MIRSGACRDIHQKTERGHMGTVSYTIIYGCKPPHSKLEGNGCLVLQIILEKGPGASATELDSPAVSARHSDTLRPQAWMVQLTTHTQPRGESSSYHLSYQESPYHFWTSLAKSHRLYTDLIIQSLWICLVLSSPEQILACLTVRTIAKQPGKHCLRLFCFAYSSNK